MRALLVPVGDHAYAVDLARAREVVTLPTLTPLPSGPPSVFGVFNLRGTIVPVFDTALLLGLGSRSDVTHVAVVDTDAGPAGLAMTDVGASVDLGEVLERTDTPGTVTKHRVDDRLVVLLDPTSLLAPTRVGA